MRCRSTFSKICFFDVQPLDDHLDDPIAIGDLFEVIIEVTGRDPFRVFFFVQRGRFALDCGGQCVDGLTIALYRVLLFFVAEVEGYDVQQKNVETDVGEVASDAGAHYAGA